MGSTLEKNLVKYADEVELEVKKLDANILDALKMLRLSVEPKSLLETTTFHLVGSLGSYFTPYTIPKEKDYWLDIVVINCQETDCKVIQEKF